MANKPLNQQRYEKVFDALERAKRSMMTADEENSIRPLLNKVKFTEMAKPLSRVDETPYSVGIPTIKGVYSIDLTAKWIDNTDIEAMIPWFVEWVRMGIRANKLPVYPRIEATKDHPGRD